MRRSCLLILVACALGCSPEPQDADTVAVSERSAEAPPVPAAVDHVLLAVNDLQAGMDEFERRTGVRPQIGGAHPGRGTRNALVSLGDAVYLEILAPNPADSAGPRAAAELAAYTSLTPYGWAARSEDLDALVDSLGARGARAAAIRPGSRIRTDGARLEWRTLGVAEPTHSFLPFFIQWGAFSAHPATTSPMGCTLGELRFEDPRPDELRRAFRQLGIDASVSSGSSAQMRMRLDCPTGTVEFPSPSA